MSQHLGDPDNENVSIDSILYYVVNIGETQIDLLAV